MAKSKLVRRFRRNKKRRSNPSPAPRRNPPLASDMLEMVGPGFASFAATRFLSRVTATQIAKRWPKFATHSGVAASVGSFLALWYLGHKVKLIDKYHAAITAGAGIAAGQTILQTYFPKLGWIVSDASPDVAAEVAGTSSTGTPMMATQSSSSTDGDFEILDETTGSWRANNDAGNAGRYTQAPRQQRPAPQQAPLPDEDSAIFDMLETDDESQSVGGIFS